MDVRKVYIRVDRFFLVLFAAIFLYAAVYPPAGGHPVPSFYTLLTGDPSPTAGLSRSFSALVRGEVARARALSPYGLPLFLFFSLQLLMRAVVLVLLVKQKKDPRSLLRVDLWFSFFLFAGCYAPLIALLIQRVSGG